MSQDYDTDDRIVEVARRTYAIERGMANYPPPDHLTLTWDGLSDDLRRFYVALVRAGYDAFGNL